MARTMSDMEEYELRHLRIADDEQIAAVFRELDAERAAHEVTRKDAEGWRNGQAQVQRDFDLLYSDTQALKAKLALAEAVCEACTEGGGAVCTGPPCGDPLCQAFAAWRAAK